MSHRPPVLFSFGAGPFRAGEDAIAEPENTARLVVQNATIELGTPTARIPITIESDFPGQLISGIYMTVAVDPPGDFEVAITGLEFALDESLWNEHPNPIQQIFPLGHNVVAFNQLTFFIPEDRLAIPCDGTVAILTIDTSKCEVPKEVRIVTDYMGYTSATVLKENWTYWPIRLEHKPAMLKIVPRRES